MGFKVLAINPGSTSTKIGVFEDEKQLFELTLRHSSEELEQYEKVIDQLDWRTQMVQDALKEADFDVNELSAVIGRGGILRPMDSGIYEVNDTMRGDLKCATTEHASNLGALIASRVAESVGVKAYIADPVVVDELDDVARLSGLPQCPRRSVFHALNQKATARLHCKNMGWEYEKKNLVITHMGGGISVAAHKRGRIVDVTNALDGEGTFSPERSGYLPAAAVADMCFSGEYTREQIQKLIAGKGGLVAHIGSNAFGASLKQAQETNDEHALLVLEAMLYNVAKNIGAMAAALGGDVDAVILTGGIVYNQPVIDYLEERCSFIAPVTAYPGEDELGALVRNVLGVLSGEVEPKIY